MFERATRRRHTVKWRARRRYLLRLSVSVAVSTSRLPARLQEK